MGTTGPLTPPYPTNDPNPSTDQTPTGQYDPQKDLDDQLAWAKTNADTLGELWGALFANSGMFSKPLALMAKVAAWIWVEELKFQVAKADIWSDIVTLAYEALLPLALSETTKIGTDVLALLTEALQGSPGSDVNFGSNAMADVASQLYEQVIQRFTLIKDTADPSQPGSGIQNQQYLLSQALTLALQEWVIDNAGASLGMGHLKLLQPFMFILDRAINPYNTVRMAMDASYSFLLREPMVRDLNRAYPIKNLGLSALTKLFIRGQITGDEFLDKCKDAGLKNEWAEQLIYETQKLLSPGDVATLLNHGYLTYDEARTRLLQQGYVPGDASMRLYLDQHARYYSIQERVGNEAVDAWKKRYIDQATLERILEQTGFTDDEIHLLEIEGELTKPWNATKELSYSQVKDMFKENILGIDDVITYLQQPDSSGRTYGAGAITKLILLDFTEAAQRQAREADLAARLRVESDTARIQAEEAANKNEQDLASAKANLSKVLADSAKLLGELQSLPGITGLLG